MKPFSFLLFLSLYVCTAFSQTKIFTTYEAFQKGEGEVMDNDFIKTFESTFGMSVKFKTTDGEEKKYNPKNIWGFTFKGHLFVSVGKELAMLVDTGKVNFFLNGFGAIGLLTNPDNTTGHYLANESSCYLSVGDLSSKIYRMPLNRYEKKDYKSFKKDFPELEELFDCMEPDGKVTGNYESIQYCVNKVNKKYSKTE